MRVNRGLLKQASVKSQRLAALPIGQTELYLDVCIERNSNSETYACSCHLHTTASQMRSRGARVVWGRIVNKRIRSATQSCELVEVGGIGDDLKQTSQPHFLAAKSWKNMTPQKTGCYTRQGSCARFPGPISANGSEIGSIRFRCYRSPACSAQLCWAGEVEWRRVCV